MLGLLWWLFKTVDTSQNPSIIDSLLANLTCKPVGAPFLERSPKTWLLVAPCKADPLQGNIDTSISCEFQLTAKNFQLVTGIVLFGWLCWEFSVYPIQGWVETLWIILSPYNFVIKAEVLEGGFCVQSVLTSNMTDIKYCSSNSKRCLDSHSRIKQILFKYQYFW